MPLSRVRILVAGSLVCAALITSSFAPYARAEGQTYIVQPQDTLSAIALRFGTTVQALMAANNLSNPNLIVAGQSLLVMGATIGGAPATTTAVAGSYVVQLGDTLSGIAARFGVSLDALAGANNIANPQVISVGTQLTIPAGGTPQATASAPASSIVPASYNSPSSPSSSAGSYVVQQGDTLSAIALRFGLTVDALATANNIADPASLIVGTSLSIPGAVVAAAAPVGQQSIGAILAEQAQAAGVDVALAKAVAWQESGWQMITASDGGMGVMQLMPDSVAWVSNNLLGTTINPYDATDNIRAGVAMLHYYLGVYGDVRQALAAYHQGMTSLQNQGILPETQSYIANILALQQQFAS